MGQQVSKSSKVLFKASRNDQSKCLNGEGLAQKAEYETVTHWKGLTDKLAIQTPFPVMHSHIL